MHKLLALALVIVGASVAAYYFATTQKWGSDSQDANSSRSLSRSKTEISHIEESTDAYLTTKTNTNSYSDRPILTVVPETEIREVNFSEFLALKPFAEYQVATVDSTALRGYVRSVNDQRPLKLNLLGSQILLRPASGYAEEHVEGRFNGFAFWKGEIEGVDWSDVLMRISPNGAVRASFQSPNLGLVYIEEIGHGPHHLVWSVDDQKIEARENGDYEGEDQ